MLPHSPRPRFEGSDDSDGDDDARDSDRGEQESGDEESEATSAAKEVQKKKSTTTR
jgi:hypothetical protein